MFLSINKAEFCSNCVLSLFNEVVDYRNNCYLFIYLFPEKRKGNPQYATNLNVYYPFSPSRRTGYWIEVDGLIVDAALYMINGQVLI